MPTPIDPTVMRLLGAVAPSFPSTAAGTTNGAATDPAAAAVRLSIARRVRRMFRELVISRGFLFFLSLLSSFDIAEHFGYLLENGRVLGQGLNSSPKPPSPDRDGTG